MPWEDAASCRRCSHRSDVHQHHLRRHTCSICYCKGYARPSLLARLRASMPTAPSVPVVLDLPNVVPLSAPRRRAS